MAKKIKKKLPARTSSNKEKDVKTLFRNNPLLVAIIGTVIGGMVVGIAILYLSEHRAEKIAKTALMADINIADEFLKRNMTYDALAIYQDTLKTVSVGKYPEIYAHIKSGEGVCYYRLANVRDKEENITRAIRAFEEALRIYTVEKYPLYYEIIMSNMRKAKQKIRNEY